MTESAASARSALPCFCSGIAAGACAAADPGLRGPAVVGPGAGGGAAASAHVRTGAGEVLSGADGAPALLRQLRGGRPLAWLVSATMPLTRLAYRPGDGRAAGDRLDPARGMVRLGDWLDRRAPARDDAANGDAVVGVLAAEDLAAAPVLEEDVEGAGQGVENPELDRPDRRCRSRARARSGRRR